MTERTAEQLQAEIDLELDIWRALLPEARTPDVYEAVLSRLLALGVPLCFAAKWLDRRTAPGVQKPRMRAWGHDAFPQRAQRP